MKTQCLFFLTLCLVLHDSAFMGGAATVGEECNTYFPKLAICLSYATGKAATPTKECCSSVKGIKDSDPKCLCYIIQQTHNGSEQIKSMGIQEGKLLQLPSACQLQNASVTNCPKLLGISPSSPDAAIFTNASAATTPTTTTPGSSASEKSGDSSGTNLGSHFARPVIVAVAIFFCAFPAGSSFIMF